MTTAFVLSGGGSLYVHSESFYGSNDIELRPVVGLSGCP